MTREQKQLCSTLIDLSFDFGFHYFPIAQLAEITKINAVDIYDPNTETGHLWVFDPRSGSMYAGLLFFHTEGSPSVAIGRETLDALETLCGY